MCLEVDEGKPFYKNDDHAQDDTTYELYDNYVQWTTINFRDNDLGQYNAKADKRKKIRFTSRL